MLIFAFIKYIKLTSTDDVITSFPIKPVSPVVRSGQLYVSPDTTDVGRLMDRVTAQLVPDGSVTYVLFGTVDEAFTKYRRNGPNVVAGINFDDGTLQNLTYTIRMNLAKIPSAWVAEKYSPDGKYVFMWDRDKNIGCHF